MTQKTRMLLQPKTAQLRKPIVQRWIETADERCPLAGMWTALTVDQQETTVEDDLPWRILPMTLRGCAISPPCIT
ncbi:hypothetical protein FTW19_15550 [Terriglobus albidus]|uniref:Uncharacterized protein n=1 Tax=Terriglobus albidus TaxID=1592106 RepID=A0A5B9ECB8_9BACT|nr:hypothetical protein [Terriglobus albidus]QEE29284.1 hypothetical protein FTW19_15550 [Terriglobus albidus]